MSHATSSPAADGERRKLAAFAMHEDRRGGLLVRARRTLLEVLLARGPGWTASIDDVRCLVPLPSGVNPKCFGAVVRPLIRAWIIRKAGQTKSVRPETHARSINVWELIDREKAIAWLSEHDPPDAERSGAGPRRQADGATQSQATLAF